MEIKAFKAISDSVVSVVLEQHPYHFEFGVIRHFTIKTGQNIFGRPDSTSKNCDLNLVLFGNKITINKYYFEEIDFKTCRYEYEWFTNRKNNFLEAFTKKFGVGRKVFSEPINRGISIASQRPIGPIGWVNPEDFTAIPPDFHENSKKFINDILVVGVVDNVGVGSVGAAIAARMKDYQIPYTPVELSTIGIPNIHDLKPKQQ